MKNTQDFVEKAKATPQDGGLSQDNPERTNCLWTCASIVFYITVFAVILAILWVFLGPLVIQFFD